MSNEKTPRPAQSGNLQNSSPEAAALRNLAHACSGDPDHRGRYRLRQSLGGQLLDIVQCLSGISEAHAEQAVRRIVPPAHLLHARYDLWLEAITDDLGRHAGDHGIGWHVPGDDGAGADDRTIADG